MKENKQQWQESYAEHCIVFLGSDWVSFFFLLVCEMASLLYGSIETTAI